jgi:hypothetical protein
MTKDSDTGCHAQSVPKFGSRLPLTTHPLHIVASFLKRQQAVIACKKRTQSLKNTPTG